MNLEYVIDEKLYGKRIGQYDKQWNVAHRVTLSKPRIAIEDTIKIPIIVGINKTLLGLDFQK